MCEVGTVQQTDLTLVSYRDPVQKLMFCIDDEFTWSCSSELKDSLRPYHKNNLSLVKTHKHHMENMCR